MNKKHWFSIFFSCLCLPCIAQSNFFVATNGNDADDGSKLHPFKTIQRAQQQARKEAGEVNIYLRDGVYLLSQPLCLTADDGGSGKTLKLCSYPDEHAVITSAIPLSLKWKNYKDGIMRARVAPGITMDMLLVNGEIRHMARFPNYDSTAIRFNGTSADATSPQRVKGWKKPNGAYLHAMHACDWGDFHYRIQGGDAKGDLQLDGGWQNNRQSGLHGENRMVENIFEELDAPGEWYYDTEESWLYYYPMQGEDIHKVTFASPQLKSLIEFRGSKQKPVTHISIERIGFTGTVRTFMEPYEPLLRSDWCIYRGGAVFLEGTEYCRLTDCDLYNLGGNAVFFSDYNRHSGVFDSHLWNIGASAVCLVGDSDAVRSPSFEYGKFVSASALDREPGPKTDNYPAECTVYGNLIHNIGLYEKQISGVELSMCSCIQVSHNSIYDTPRAGINIGDGTWGGHVIEFNDVFDTVKETGDHGSFNSWGRDRYWHPDRGVMDSLVASEPELILLDAVKPVILRNNRFRCDRGWDIDLDDGSSNFMIYNNLCLNGGIKLREGFYRVVENNIMVNNAFHPHVWFQNSGDVFVRNLVMTSYRPIGINSWGKEIDYNIFLDNASMKASQAQGTDKHSIAHSPHFVNPSQGDYRIAPNQHDIFRLGFKNFDMSSFGVTSPRLKPQARVPHFPNPVEAEDENKQSSITWKGLQVKNLDTLGERSATGMDSERGVYVISVDALECPLRDYIQPNDVILGFNDAAVNNLDDLKRASDKEVTGAVIKMVLFRNQKNITVEVPK